MDTNFPQAEFRYISKNSKYLDPKHKALAKRSFKQEKRVQNYYKFQARISDATSTSFLLGRNALIKQLPFAENEPFSLLEVGSGTGYNLKNIAAAYPKAHLTGMEVSEKMINISKKKLATNNQQINFLHAPYNETTGDLLIRRPKVILFSYALTKKNPQWKQMILQAKNDMTTIGYIAVVDFHDSRLNWFKNHMQRQHISMDGQLLPFLQNNFEPIHESVDNAYGGLWQYFSFVGKLVD